MGRCRSRTHEDRYSCIYHKFVNKKSSIPFGEEGDYLEDEEDEEEDDVDEDKDLLLLVVAA